MSAIAEILCKKGHIITGSDSTEKKSTRRLRGEDITIYIGHSANYITDQDVVVYTAAIPNDNEELKKAMDSGKTCMVRSQMLGRLMSEYKNRIAVAGAHGKTTTTTFIDSILKKGGCDVTSMIGAAVPELGGNARLGNGDIFLTEACEAFESFLDLNPSVAVITNIDRDHLDYYGTFDKIEAAFLTFCRDRVDADGTVIYCRDNEVLSRVANQCGKRLISFGFSDESDYSARNIKVLDHAVAFDVYKKNELFDHMKLNLLGDHNVLNSLAAIVCADLFGVSKQIMKEALEAFQPPSRRFNVVYDKDIMIVDDYAHHPTEITATLTAVKKHYPGRRIIVVFQPHLYSRTQAHLEDFAKSLSIADHIIVTEIYAAREKPIKGITGDIVQEAIDARGYKKSVFLKKKEIVSHVNDMARPGDIVLVLGAGDINSVCAELCEIYNGVG